MTWETWISLVLLAGVAIVTPGPGNLNTLRRAVELGHRSAIFSVMGNGKYDAYLAAQCQQIDYRS